MEELVEAHHLAGNTLGHTEFTPLAEDFADIAEKTWRERATGNERRLLDPWPKKYSTWRHHCNFSWLPGTGRRSTTCWSLWVRRNMLCSWNHARRSPGGIGDWGVQGSMVWYSMMQQWSPGYSSHETSQISEYYLVGQRKGLNNRTSSSSLSRL